MTWNPLNWLMRAARALTGADMRAQVAAVSRALPIIEFDLEGNVLTANENFLKASQYSREELRGAHHSMFVDPEYRQTAAYREFWDRLRRGEQQSAQYKRLGKKGRVVWVQATYYPIIGLLGRPYKVVKHTVDITEQMMKLSDGLGQLAAISKAQGVIEFELDGTIRTANENFLSITGYKLEELRGRHHSMLVDGAERDRPDRALWAKLGRGEHESGQYRRIGRGGRELWIQASYNPILDAEGKPFKVVKYATDVTAQVHFSVELQGAVREAQAAVSAAARGDLTRRVSFDGKSDEIRALSKAINALIEVMCALLQQIKHASREVYKGAEEISAGNNNLSQRTDAQATSLEEAASSMEEMASSVKHAAENAAQANELAIAACEQAERGGAVVGAAVTAMSGINGAAAKIADIIGVIDEIAFQTNLLALNAAVEAARAGEQGRGFAVVASEVRNLAGRSATAAKEIKALIQDSVARVGEGSKLVDESGRTLQAIVAAIKKATAIVSEIAVASREQSSGIDQVNRVVVQMEQVTQQNAALVEEAAASSESILQQARALASTVARYQLDGAEPDAAAPRSPTASRSAPARALPATSPGLTGTARSGVAR